MSYTERALVFVGVGCFLFVYVVLGSRLVNFYRRLRPTRWTPSRWAPLLTFALAEILRFRVSRRARATEDQANEDDITKTIRTARAVLTVSALAFLAYLILSHGRQ